MLRDVLAGEQEDYNNTFCIGAAAPSSTTRSDLIKFIRLVLLVTKEEEE